MIYNIFFCMLFLFSESNFVYAQEQESSVTQQDENCFCDPNSGNIIRLVDDLATLMSSYYPDVKELLDENTPKTIVETCYPKEHVDPIMKTLEELTQYFSEDSEDIKGTFQDILDILETPASSATSKEECEKYGKVLSQKIQNLMSFF